MLYFDEPFKIDRFGTGLLFLPGFEASMARELKLSLSQVTFKPGFFLS
jgi:hypothetical protein